jgi:polar amino acid transport system substrate-binding protein
LFSYRISRYATATALALVSALALSACAGAEDADSDESPAAQAGAGSIALPTGYEGRALVPTVLTNYAPLGFTDADGELTGLDYDFAEAIGEELGVEVEIVGNSWENGLLGIDGDKYDWTGSAAISAERIEKYDMTSYFTSGDALMTSISSPDIGDEATDLCGLSVSALSGDAAVDQLTAANATCEAEGLDEIDIRLFPAIPDAQLAAKSGNVDAWYTGVIYAAYIKKEQPGEWKVTGPKLRATVTNGFITRKDSGLAEVLAEAINATIADGTYAEILEKWNISDQAIPAAEVNPVIPAASPSAG